MAILNLTNEQIRSKLYGLSSLHDNQRAALLASVLRLNAASDWYPESLHRELLAIETNGVLNEFERHLVEKAFFPDHAWLDHAIHSPDPKNLYLVV